MEKTVDSIIDPAELLAHWQGHRALTRRVIEAFPEKDFFGFRIGGMRPFAEMVKELLAIAEPGIREIATGKTQEFDDRLDKLTSKAQFLQKWDGDTEKIDRHWAQVPIEKFREERLAFNQYEGTNLSHIFYFIDNEIHHRGQGYVYLRALGIEPPFFWERTMLEDA